jgi:hypothetical protein
MTRGERTTRIINPPSNRAAFVKAHGEEGKGDQHTALHAPFNVQGRDDEDPASAGPFKAVIVHAAVPVPRLPRLNEELDARGRLLEHAPAVGLDKRLYDGMGAARAALAAHPGRLQLETDVSN